MRPPEDGQTGSAPPAAPPAAGRTPSIAVVPFDNMSGDPEQEYFADGIAEDVIIALSRFRWFYVTARNSSFSYTGKSSDVRAVGRELGVRYVLEGSVKEGRQPPQDRGAAYRCRDWQSPMGREI